MQPSFAGILARLVERVPELLVLAWLASQFVTATDKMSSAVQSMANRVGSLEATLADDAARERHPR